MEYTNLVNSFMQQFPFCCIRLLSTFLTPKFYFMERPLKSETVMVVGATGLLGMEICSQLRDAGKQVNALVRTTSAPEKVEYLKKIGVKIVIGDMKNLASLQLAFEDADA